MQLNKIGLLLTFFTISLGKSIPGLITFNATDIDPSTKEITISFTIPKKDFIYKDFITCSVDDPQIALSSWKVNKESVSHYDSSFKEAKQIFNEDFTITMSAILRQAQDERMVGKSSHLYCTYYRKSEKKINLIQFPLFFTASPSNINEMIDTITMIEEYEPTKKINKKPTYIQRYTLAALTITHTIITSLRTDHKKYFALLLFLLSVILSFFYFFKAELQKQIRIKELLEIIISLFLMTIATYLLIYTYIISTPLVAMIMASICTLYAGLFYIKKSTKVQSKNLRTLCTFLGILCICSTLLLLFKVLQYADQQFNLL